jgi:hypothetical protein
MIGDSVRPSTADRRIYRRHFVQGEPQRDLLLNPSNT